MFTKKPLIMQNADSTKRQEIRKQSKKHAEIAATWLKGITSELVEDTGKTEFVEDYVNCVVSNTVQQTTHELVGSKQLEKQMKKSCIKYC